MGEAPGSEQADFLHVRLVHSADGRLIAEIDGELSHATTAPALELLMDAIDRGETQIVLDLNGLGFCDSAGLGFLVKLQQRADDAGGWLRLARPGPMLRHLLQVTQLDQALHLYESVGQAAN